MRIQFRQTTFLQQGLFCLITKLSTGYNFAVYPNRTTESNYEIQKKRSKMESKIEQNRKFDRKQCFERKLFTELHSLDILRLVSILLSIDRSNTNENFSKSQPVPI